MSPFSSLYVCEVGVSQNTEDAEPLHHFMLRGGPGQMRGAPLGDVLTPRERALLRTADPVSGRLPVEVR